MYADKDKQREAVRLAVQKHRLKKKGITETEVRTVSDGCNTFTDVIPSKLPDVIPEKVRPAVKPVIAKRDAQPVPAWRADKDAQMARFLSGKR